MANRMPANPAIPGGSLEGLKDIQPPLAIPDPWRWVLASLAVIAVVALLYYLFRVFQNRKQVLRMPVKEPSHLRARRRLDHALRLMPDPPAFAVEISAALRDYLEERFELHAPDRTTEEFLLELQSNPVLTEGQTSALSEFLNQCDLLKFARYEPTETELTHLHHLALVLVQETEPIETLQPEGPQR